MQRLIGRLSPFLKWARKYPRLLPLSTDCAMWLAGFAIAAALRVLNQSPLGAWELVAAACVAVAGQVLVGVGTGTYRARWRITSFEEVALVGAGWLAVSLAAIAASQVVRQPFIDAPRFSILAGAVVAGYGMLASRTIWRYLWQLQRRPDVDQCKRTIVFGAGEGGEQMVRAMLSDPDSAYYPVALLDDDRLLRNRRIASVVVEGTLSDVAQVAGAHNADALLVAIAGANAALIQDASQLAAAAGLEIRVLPATSELVGKMTVADMRPPTVEDLLGRDPVEIDIESVTSYIRGKRVLITGAGGSIGSELSRQVRRLGPSELYLLDRDESALHGLQLTMEGRALLDSDDLIVGDIRDRERIFEIFEMTQPEVVFHTAALKHLTLLQNHPDEGVKTNVLGSKNLLDASMKYGVERFVNISTDKAADPTSVLGATKLAAERLTAIAAQQQTEAFLSVRFGNVLGSRGSVLPTFMDQIQKGHNLTVTDPEATRYFMTIPEAVCLVIQAGAIGDPGEVLVLDMGHPVKIMDLAQRLINLMNPALSVEITGLRSGEKLHEVLVASNEIGAARVHPRIIHTKAELLDPTQALEIMGESVMSDVRQRLGHSPLSVG